MQDRAYSVLEIKAVSDDERLIEGIATTPSTDRMGDVIEPLGARFAAELPLLWQHDHASPVGHVKFGKPTAKGIPFTANIVKIAEEGELKALVDKAWQSVKARLVRAVSIGFRPIEYSLMEGGGVRFLETEILELSLVTVPANSDCTITQIRSIDTQLRAASGSLQAVDERVSPGAPGNPAKVIPALADRQTRSKPMANRTVAEQISAYQSARETKAARMTEIMQAAADKGETLDAEATEEYDGLDAEVKSIDAHLKRLDALEKANAATAKPVDSAVDTKTGSAARAPARVEVKGANLPKGTAFTRDAARLIAEQERGGLDAAARDGERNYQARNMARDFVDVLASDNWAEAAGRKFRDAAFDNLEDLLATLFSGVTGGQGGGNSIGSMIGSALRNLIPGFSAGTRSAPGGLSYVHKGEVLANLPKGTSVIPAHAVRAMGALTNQAQLRAMPAAQPAVVKLVVDEGAMFSARVAEVSGPISVQTTVQGVATVQDQQRTNAMRRRQSLVG